MLATLVLPARPLLRRSSAAARVRALLLLLLRHPHQLAHLGSSLRHRLYSIAILRGVAISFLLV